MALELMLYLCKIKLEIMLILLTMLLVAYLIDSIWCPRLAWIDNEDMLIMHYNKKNTRVYLVIVKIK